VKILRGPESKSLCLHVDRPAGTREGSSFDWLAVWILFSSWCTLSGWGLSCLGGLNRAGYLGSLLLFAGGIVLGRRHLQVPGGRPLFLLRKTSYARWLPKLWLALALLILAGGLLYHPDNYDYLTYRFPRLLHWTWDGHWSWLTTANDRQNFSATGMEWLMAPWFVLFQTDRLFFIINFISYLFLPGLVFSVLRQLGISGRLCWWWMWVLPAGFCFALQAGGTGNDMFGVVYLLAAIHYIFRAAREKSSFHLALSLLAIALMTGTKASTLPLVALWLAILGWNRQALRPVCRPGLLLLSAAVGVVVCFFPVALLNLHFTGDYTGDPTNRHGVKLTHPLAGVVANSIELVVGNLAPPVWTHDLQWESFQPALRRWLRSDYPRFDITATAFQIEETAGVGPGIVAFAALGMILGLSRPPRGASLHVRRNTGTWWIVAGTAVACLAYLTKMGSEAAPRLFAAYYVAGLMALLLLVPLDGAVTHRRLWKGLAYLAMALVFPLVLLNPSRPLVPVGWIETGFQAVHLPSSALSQLNRGYGIRAHRLDNLAELRRRIPPSEHAAGYLGGGDDPEVSPWLPFGSRKIVEVTDKTTAADLQNQGVHYVLVSDAKLATFDNVKIEDLEKKWSMTVIAQSNLTFKTHRGFSIWYLLHST
jgi:hypothetical protein